VEWILLDRATADTVPTEIISYCVWLYFRFSVSYRDVEELMAERGVTLTYEMIRT
jgi:putative transposase